MEPGAESGWGRPANRLQVLVVGWGPKQRIWKRFGRDERFNIGNALYRYWSILSNIDLLVNRLKGILDYSTGIVSVAMAT